MPKKPFFLMPFFLATVLKMPFFFLPHFWPKVLMTVAPAIVVPDQGENRCRQSFRHKEAIAISCTARFVTREEI